MVKFQTINNQLCLMLEKPIPLTEDAKFPCVARLIQDDSPMGRFNSGKTAYINDIYICDGIGEHGSCAISSNNNLHHPACLELLGYPVVDGSKEWALWQMQQENYVIHEGLTPCNIHCDMVTWLDSPESKQYTMQSPDKWLMYCPFKDGWQLYEPKAETQPCPACNGTGVVKPAFEVGDWVEYGGEHVEVMGSGKSRGDITLLGLRDQKHQHIYTSVDADTVKLISPSEVVIRIGCLSGTVCKCDDVGMEDTHFYLHIPGTEDDKNAATWCLISFAMLKQATAVMVRELIEKQEGE